MKKKRMPKSIRKFIRREKARIRRQVFNVEEQNKMISEIYNKVKKDFVKEEENTTIEK